MDDFGGNTGTLPNGGSFVAGAVGKAFVFDGINQSVQIPYSGSLVHSNFSVEAWVKPLAQVNDAIGQEVILGQSYGAYQLVVRSGNSGVRVAWQFGTDHFNFYGVEAATEVPIGEFSHLAGTWDGATLRLYINGILSAQAVPGTRPVDSGCDFSIGGFYLPQADNCQYVGQFFNGVIDETSLYSRVLSPTEILAIYRAGSAGKCGEAAAPRILEQPRHAAAFVGGTTNFSVHAVSSLPLGYQWRFNDTDLPEKTTHVLSLQNLQVTNGGNYSVVITNALGAVTSSVAVLTVLLPPPCVTPPDGLVSWWRFENSILDNWGLNDGMTNLPPSFLPGKVGKALQILQTRFVRVTDSPSLDLTNAFTLEAWVNPTVQSGFTPRTILAKFDYPQLNPLAAQSSYYLGTTNNGRLCLTVSASGSVRTNFTVVNSEPLPLGKWTLVTATYDGAELRLYTNATLAAAASYSAGVFASSSDLGIGAIPTQSTLVGWPFWGSIDEVSIYSRALTPDEIAAVYSSDFVGKCLAPPVITANPLSEAVAEGEDVRFTTSASGSRPFQYQWKFNGTNLPGATNAALLVEKLTGADAGFYSVSVSNPAGSALSASALLKLLPPNVCTATPEDAVAWWPADDSAGDVIGGNVAIGSAVNYPSGKVGRAFGFNGTSSLLTVASSSALNFGSNVNFSIGGWIRTRGTAPQWGGDGTMPIIEKRSLALTNAVGYSLQLVQGRLGFWMGTAPQLPTNNLTFVSAGPDLRDGMFHHVAMTLDRRIPNGGALYVDGQLVGRFDAAGLRGDLTTFNSMRIGYPAFSANGVGPFFGMIDELALYRRALSEEEVRAIAGAGAAGQCKVPPSIVMQPVDQSVKVSSNAMFTVLATGSPTLRYQWYRGNTIQFGRTNATLGLTNVQTFAQGLYSVTVANAFGSVTSSNAMLIVEPLPALPVGSVLRLEAGGQPGLSFNGLPGQRYLVQASTNLFDWVTLGEATDLGDGRFQFVDSEASARDASFYRVIQP